MHEIWQVVKTKPCLAISFAAAFKITFHPFQESRVFFTPLTPAEKDRVSDLEPFDPYDAGIKISMIQVKWN